MLKNTNRLKTVIVDFDNTLFDTNTANYNSYKSTFKHYGVKFNYSMFRNFSGLNKKDFYQKVIGKKALKIIDEIYEKKKNLLFKKFKICKNKSSVIFNIANFKKK